MNWREVRNGRLLAGVYLTAFAMLVAGVLWLLILQWTSETAVVPAGILFLGGGFTIIGMAVGLRNRAPALKNRLTKSATGYQRMYHRLALGLELPGAWRAVRG
jgi:hypothetical protein